MNLEEPGRVAWTYKELLLVKFIENEPVDCGEGGREGILLKTLATLL